MGLSGFRAKPLATVQVAAVSDVHSVFSYEVEGETSRDYQEVEGKSYGRLLGCRVQGGTSRDDASGSGVGRPFGLLV